MSNPHGPLSPEQVRFWDRMTDNFDVLLEVMRKLPRRRWDGTKLVPVQEPDATPEDLVGPRFSAALVLANELHGSQLRKGTPIPYIAHLLSVAALVIEAGGDEDTAIAALLHDTVEDQGGRPMLDRIRARFGPTVADIVEACSDTDVTPKPPWRRRKEDYLASIPHKSEQALLVSLADKVHNAGAILSDYKQLGEPLWSRFTGGREGTLWYYRALADAFRGRTPTPLWQSLEDTVAELEALAAAH